MERVNGQEIASAVAQNEDVLREAIERYLLTETDLRERADDVRTELDTAVTEALQELYGNTGYVDEIAGEINAAMESDEGGGGATAAAGAGLPLTPMLLPDIGNIIRDMLTSILDWVVNASMSLSGMEFMLASTIAAAVLVLLAYGASSVSIEEIRSWVSRL